MRAPPPNRPPITPDQFFTVDGGRCTTLNVLAAVTDPDGVVDPTSVRAIVSESTRGCVQVLSGGRIKFTPDAGFLGTTCFQYRVCDTRGLCSEGTVTVTVVPASTAGLQFNVLFD